MKNKKYKYLTAISSFAVSVFMLFDWFIIKAMGTDVAHSFITIPSRLTSGADFLKQIGGKTAAIFILIMAGLVEFMCITAAVMGIWGGIRCLIKPYKSKLITMSQLVAVTFTSIAIMAVLIINVISFSSLGGVISVKPTLWLALDVVFLILSYVFSSKYPSEYELEKRKTNL